MSSTSTTQASPTPRASGQAVLTGVYVNLDQLLGLRHKQYQSLNAQSRIVGNRAGQKLSKVKGRGVDFTEVRPYQPGDDVRTMDWRVTARKNKPHTKVFREERERPVLIALDQTQNMFFGSKVRLKSVAAAEIATRIAWANLAAGDRIGGIVFGNNVQLVHKPVRSTKSVARLLNTICDQNNTLHRHDSDHPAVSRDVIFQSVQDGLLQLRRLCKTNYRVFVISDFSFPSEFWGEHLHQLARSNEVFMVHINDPLDADLPPADHYAVSDGQSRLQFYTGESGLRTRYQKRYAHHLKELQALCAHDAMRFQSVSTDDVNLDRLHWV